MNKRYLFDYSNLDDYEKKIMENIVNVWKYTWTLRFKLRNWRFFLKRILRRRYE